MVGGLIRFVGVTIECKDGSPILAAQLPNSYWKILWQSVFLSEGKQFVGLGIRAVLLGLAAAVGLGIARFAYGLVLPDMRADLGWNYSLAGWLGTANAAGYLLGAIVCASVANRFGLHRSFVWGVWATAFAVAAMGLSADFWWLSSWRFVAGLTGAFCFVLGGAVAAQLAASADDVKVRGTIISLFYAAPGSGVLLSALCVPLVLWLAGPGNWKLTWLVLGAIAAVFACLVWLGSRGIDGSAPVTNTGRANFKATAHIALLLAYASFGAGYICYVTFMYAHLQEGGASATALTLFWCTMGIGTMISPWLWASVLETFRRGYAFAFLSVVVAVGAALPLFSSQLAIAYLSALVFGSALFTVPATTTVFVRRNFIASEWPKALGTLTVAFGIGQIVGPTLGGYVSDVNASLSYGLTWGAGFLIAGAVFALLQPDAMPD